MAEKEYSDQELIEALRRGGTARREAWEYMFKKWSPVWEYLVVKQGGTADEAHNAFQGIVMAVEKAWLKDGFTLKTATLKTYLIKCIVNRWVWLKRTGKLSNSTPRGMENIHKGEPEVEASLLNNDLRQTLDKLLGKIKPCCRQVLIMHSQGFSMKEIAEEMGLENAVKAKSEKYKCMMELREYLNNNPEIMNHLKNLLND